MPTVTMPDGTLVDMPEAIDAQLGARLRAFHEAHATKSPQDYDPTPKGGVPEGFHEIHTNGAPYIVHDATINDAIRALSDLPGVGMAERFGQGATRLAGKAASGLAGLVGGPDTVQKVQSAVNSATELPPSNDPLVTASNAVGNVAGTVAAPVDRAIGNLPAGPRTLLEATEEAAPDVLPLVGGLGTALAGRMTSGTKLARSGEEISKAAGYTGLKTKLDLTSPGNQAITDTLISKDAGIVSGQPPSVAALENAIKVGPAKVYDAAEKAIPRKLSQDAELQAKLGNLPNSVSTLPRSPDVEALQETMLAKPEFTRDELFANIREARERAKVHWKSDDPDKAALGDAYHALASAYEDFAGRQLEANPDADVSLADWQSARTQMAKNYQAQGALRGPQGGEHFNPQAYARVMEKDPHLLTGNAAIVGHVANALPSALPPGTMPGIAEATGHTAGIIPVVGPLLKAKLEQLRLRGNPELAAGAATNPELSDFFNRGRLPPGWNRSPVEPKIAGLLPSPDMVNAGGGATTLSMLESLGLTPDVQAAGAQHPGAVRLAALREQLAQVPERSAESVDFQGPQKWGDFSLTPQAPVTPALEGGIPFENVLEQGGNQRQPIAGIDTRARTAPRSPKGPNMRTPPGAPELAEGPLPGPSDAQLAFRSKLAADRLRKVAGDLRVEGPGGASGSPIDRLREALVRRERGYAEGGDVPRRSSSPGSPGFSGAMQDALSALKDYVIDMPKRELQAQREHFENSIVDDTRAAPETPQYAEGGEVGLVQKLGQLFSRARGWLAPVAPALENSAPRQLPNEEYFNLMRRSMPNSTNPLSLDELNRLIGELSRAPSEEQILGLPHQLSLTEPQVNSLLERPAGFADGGEVDPQKVAQFNAHSSLRKLADAARALDNPSGTDPNAENRARVTANVASLLYGLDKDGNPVFGGRAWTPSQGGTPMGVLDALTATPHNLVQMASLIDRSLPGKSNPQFWASIDPQWSRQAADRLDQLRQRVQQTAGLGHDTSLGATLLDTATDPALLAPMGAAGLAGKGTIARRLLNTVSGGGEDSKAPAQGFAKGGSVGVRPIQDLPRDKEGMFVQPPALTDEIAVWVEHNRARASKKAFYADDYCGDPKTVDPAGKYNCGSCNQADGKKCLWVYDDTKPNKPPLVIDRDKGSCGPYEIIDRDDPEQRGNRMPTSVANYGVRKGGGPNEVFGCSQCWKGKKSAWPAVLTRNLWCGEWGTTVQPHACCTMNGAPTE